MMMSFVLNNCTSFISLLVVSHRQPCENGGIFVPLGSDGFECICPHRFKGKACSGMDEIISFLCSILSISF